MVRTIEQHAETIRGLVESALAGRGTHLVAVQPGRIAEATDRSDRSGALAARVVSPIDLPPFDNSQMDGYAVRSSDLAAGSAALRVAARIPAGHEPAPLEAGWAAPIMTGAPVPDGADAIIPIEDAQPDAFLPDGVVDGIVTLPGPVGAGRFVRRQGSDLVAGATLFEAGTVVRAAQWGSLAAAGVETVRLIDRPRILLVSTGEELTEPGRPLAPGAIYDANGASLAAALTDAGAEVIATKVSDDADALIALVRQAITERHIDLVVTMGGVSAGAYEVVRDAFEGQGVTFDSVAMQPGGPQGWGVVSLGDVRVPVIAFPGNPVSVLVSFEAFLRGPLLEARGRRAPRHDITAVLAEGADSPVGKHQIRRARLDEAGRVHFVGGPSSHLLHSYAQATVLAHIPLGVGRVEAGDEVVVWALDD